jgi:transposase
MARPADRFVKSLTDKKKRELEEFWKNGVSHRLRCRAHAILLSDQKRSVSDIAEVFQVTSQTVYAWLERWESHEDLEDAPRSGAPPKLNADETNMAIEELQKTPHNPREALERINSQTGKQISVDLLRRLAKKCGLGWKRMRGSVRDRRDETAFQAAKVDLIAFSELAQEPDINLWFFDEAAFSLKPSIPYAWQEIGKTIELPVQKGASYSAVGFVDLNSHFFAYQFPGTVSSEIAVSVMDAFAQKVTGTNIVVIDNAPVHRSQDFQSRIDEWREQGLHLYFLPPYSPELNLIEIVWRQIKQHWISLAAYTSPKHLWDELSTVLSRIGTEYKLNYSWPEFIR